MYDYLNDINFLTYLDKLNLRTHYARITLLQFKDESPVKQIQGNITSGNLNVNGSSAIRRTINLSMVANLNNSDIEDIDSDIAIDKKVKIEVGYKNITHKYKDDDIIWFPCGIFVISSASVARGITGWNISISGKDKMCLLDGTAGGTFPAPIIFHERLVELENGDYKTEYPIIRQIIFEAVNHYGGEKPENIIISDLQDKVKLLVKYVGENPIYFDSQYTNLSFIRDDMHQEEYFQGDDIGYEETDFTYPGELVCAAGDTVVTLLDKITKTLGNFEYFYTIDGKFVFQEIKNYLNTGSPLDELNANDYITTYSNCKYLYDLTDLDTTTQINRNPKYENIKNDFYAWGARQTSSGVEVGIRYHLAIDTKPSIYYANKYMWEVYDTEKQQLMPYEFTDSEDELIGEGWSFSNLNKEQTNGILVATLIAGRCQEWREELYRLALQAQVTNSVYNNYYDSELIAEWRNLYDPSNKDWNSTNHWNPIVFKRPKEINFWLDFLDGNNILDKYSIERIGRRTKAVADDSLKSVYNTTVPDVIFLKTSEETSMKEYYDTFGQNYFQVTDQLYDLFSASSTGASCFDRIRDMLYQNLSYNTTISITCLPKYYIEPNNIIHITDEKSKIDGNFLITQFSLPLAYNGTMSITATEVLTRV